MYKSNFIITLLVVFVGCQQESTVKTNATQSQGSSVYRPESDLGVLFHDVQLAGIYEDSKTFVDAEPTADPAKIKSDYQQAKNQQSFKLTEFIHHNFKLPGSASGGSLALKDDMGEHLRSLWPLLTREPDRVDLISSLLPLPNSYVVPGGRFREVYYWDSYFTMLGLLESGQDQLVLSMIQNFAYLIDTYGFIPNGNRSYYLGRSQPPFFTPMVMLLSEYHGMDSMMNFLPQMQLEYDFWMKGSDELSEENSMISRVVRLSDGTILNRYWDNYPEPRPESYREDYELAESFPESEREQVYRDLRAGAESGWDYSSRWFSDGKSMDSIITTQILPVDLNCLMYFMEKSLSELYQYSGNEPLAKSYDEKSVSRASAIRNYFWDTELGYFSDYHIGNRQTTKHFSAAGIVPLYFMIATEGQSKLASKFLEEKLLYPGGIVSTLADTGQQWDFPNGWAPQQWMAIKGLRNYKDDVLADEIAKRWLFITNKVFKDTGKMMEKYNVVDLSLSAGGGEYPTQDGFGWTNGVTLKLLSETSE